MNQSILFPDMQSWDEEKQVVIFPAQSQGALIECVVSKCYLERLHGSELKDEKAILSAFVQLRFDLEEEAETLIEDEMFSSSGQIAITD